ncbi:MAG: hypothetical protein IKX97_06485, partial [Erysipelotrichaceae bacterium]|nr:hypothetical protein [Erysipelotrichaceae bacterium]
MKTRKMQRSLLTVFTALLLLFSIIPANRLSIAADDDETYVEVVEQEAVEQQEETAVEEETLTEMVEDIVKDSTVVSEIACFDQEVTVDDVVIKVAADAGTFPEDSILSVEKVSSNIENEIQDAIDEVRDGDLNVATSYTFDIKVLDEEGNELQPADDGKVTVSFTLAHVDNDNLNTQVYHIEEEELTVEELDVETEGDTAIVETDGFSYYTVEFTYGNLEYVLEGDGYVKLSDLLSYVGLTGEVESY